MTISECNQFFYTSKKCNLSNIFYLIVFFFFRTHNLKGMHASNYQIIFSLHAKNILFK